MTHEIHQLYTELEQSLSDIFNRMDIAEDEISAAIVRDPSHGDAYNGSFGLLLPTETLHSDILYRNHCRNILGRVAIGEDTRPGTDAEVLGAFSMATLVAPPGRTLTLAYARLFGRMFPERDDIYGTLTEHTGQERTPGDVDNLIAKTRRKLAVADRVRG